MTTKTLTYYSGQFEINQNLNIHRNGYSKILDSDPLIAATKLNNRLHGKVQNIFIMLGQRLGQKITAGNTVKCQVNFLAHLLWSSISKLTCYTFIQITSLCVLLKNLKKFIPLWCALVFWSPVNWPLLRVTNFKRRSKMP